MAAIFEGRGVLACVLCKEVASWLPGGSLLSLPYARRQPSGCQEAASWLPGGSLMAVDFARRLLVAGGGCQEAVNCILDDVQFLVILLK